MVAIYSDSRVEGRSQPPLLASLTFRQPCPIVMNRSLFRKSSRSSKELESNGENESISSGSSSGSASIARSETSKLAAASSLVTTRGALPLSVRGVTSSLPLPCHLRCECEDCRRPNAKFLDSLMNFAPRESITAKNIDDPLGLLLSDMDDFAFGSLQGESPQT